MNDYHIRTITPEELTLLEQLSLMASKDPEMTGYELYSEISEKYPNIIVLLTSGYSDTKNIGIDISEIHILAKPYSKADLLKLIEETINSL